MYEIIIGRKKDDIKKFGKRGTIFIGKNYVEMGKEVSLANPILLDIARPHVILIAGKRGSGKSYTMGVMVEAITNLPKEVKNNIAMIMFDTLGIYWSVKFPNYRQFNLLDKWGLQPKGMSNVVVFAPYGKFEELKKDGIPVDKPFSIKTSSLSIADWIGLFNLPFLSEASSIIREAISKLKGDYSIDDIVEAIKDVKGNEKEKRIAISLFHQAKELGIFKKDGNEAKDLLIPGTLTVLDLSPYTQETYQFSIKALIIGLISRKLLEERIRARKKEELKDIEEGYSLFKRKEEKKEVPLIWLFIDEAHEFLPEKGETLATLPLIRIIREGRQPGISLVLATQQPGKINSDVITQCDIVISHRLTAKIDLEALNNIMQSYLPYQLARYIEKLPRRRGAALVLDDNQEKIFMIQIRPKQSWHGGEEPKAISEEKKLLS